MRNSCKADETYCKTLVSILDFKIQILLFSQVQSRSVENCKNVHRKVGESRTDKNVLQNK